MIILLWIVFCFLVGNIGTDRKIGYWGLFIISLVLSPLVGLIIGLLSPKIVHHFKSHIELGKMSEYKGKIQESIEHYMNGLYHLENDYKNELRDEDFKGRDKLIEEYKLKVEQLKIKLNEK